MNVKFMWPPKRRPQQSWTLCELWYFGLRVLERSVCECILFGVTLLRDANHWTTTTIKSKRIENGWWTARRKELLRKNRMEQRTSDFKEQRDQSGFEFVWIWKELRKYTERTGFTSVFGVFWLLLICRFRYWFEEDELNTDKLQNK